MAMTKVKKECGFIKQTGEACTKVAKYGRRCGIHKGKRNKRTTSKTSTETIKKPKKSKTKKITKKEKGTTKRKRSKKAGSRSQKRSQFRGDKVRFYDVKRKKYVLVPRSECKVKRSKGRGGDQLYTVYDGRKLFTFVPKGFKL